MRYWFGILKIVKMKVLNVMGLVLLAVGLGFYAWIRLLSDIEASLARLHFKADAVHSY